MRRDEAWLLDMLDACREIAQFTAGVSREAFLADKMLQRAVCMNLEIIGEAGGVVSQAFRDAHAEIAWGELKLLRNRIAHEYFRLDLDLLWEIAQDDIPALKAQIEPLVPPDVPQP